MMTSPLSAVIRRPIASCSLCILLLLTTASAGLAATTATLDIDVNKPGAAIPPNFYGLMTEEINHSYDGGLFAELVQNRTFQDDQRAPAHWSTVGDGKMEMDRNNPVNPNLPVSLRLDLANGSCGVANDGYWGIPLRPDTKYVATFYAKGSNGFAGPVTASIVANDGNIRAASADSDAVTGEWKKYSVDLTTSHETPTTANAKFVLSASGSGSVWFSFVSLFPPTYMDTPNGLRPDLMKLMADLHPAFIRLPGGNYLEGDTFATRYNWKQMIGPADQRPGHMGCWSYRSSDGFGLPQELLWCKQLNAEPVLAVFAGYTLNHDHVVAGPDLQPYVDEALQEIEYVSGPADSEWGKLRVADGLTEPFKLHYIEVGNEDFFDKSGSYDGRYAQFYDAIRAKYPDLKIIATTPVRSRNADLVDDHYYRSPRAMAFDGGHYDQTDRNGPHIFVGEWASQEGKPTPDLKAGLADAAWLMGLERDADVVRIESYAPLFVNVNPKAWQWGTNLIGYDAMSSFGSPSYYAQAMFGQNKGDTVLPAKLGIDQPAAAAAAAPHGGIGIGTWHTQVEYKDISVSAADGTMLMKPDQIRDTNGWNLTGCQWTVQDNVIKPDAPDSESWAMFGDLKWTDYTVRLKARKTGGAEGFLILFHAAANDDYRWWNVGGWGDTHTQVEACTNGNSRGPFGPISTLTVETDRWYDLRLEVRGNSIKCFADDQLVTDTTEQSASSGAPVFASATYATPSHEIIVKVVNLGDDPVDATLNLHGAAQITAAAKAIVLSGNPTDVNTIDEPTKVAPKEEAVTDAAASFHRTFPANSLTLLRISATPQ
jgi:alpha-L-arabinofuranosidase